MDNIMMLQRQCAKPVKIAMLIADACVVAVVAIVTMSGATKALFSGIWIALALVLIHVFLLRARKPDESLEKLPPDILASTDRECMRGLRWSNGILCENGCLLIVGMNLEMNVKAVLLRDIKSLSRDELGHMNRILVTDRQGKVYPIVNSSRTVQGNGTFREADMETFWEELNIAKERADVDPKQDSLNQNFM